jgi:ribosome maturation factor RimP
MKGGFTTKRADIEAKTTELVMPIIEANGLELVDVEYVKEGSDFYLRIYADKEGGINIGDCEIVNRALSDLLDENDYINDAYILEVSSPGLTRPLKKENDFRRSIGKIVEIKTFTKINNCKEFEGELTAYDDETVTIITDRDEELVISRKDISMIRLAFVM